MEAEDAGQRIDRFLAGEDTGLSRSALQNLIAEGRVLANGQPAAKNRKLKAGDTILLEIPDAAPIAAVAQDIPLDIVYEDAHLLVVNKPKGMVVHPAPGNPDGTLVNALLFHCRGSLSGIGGEIRPGIVHRIDKDTSGLLVVAKDDATHIGLSRQMAEHSVERAYQTVVYGGFAQDEGFVEGYLGRSKTDRKKMAVYPAGEPHTKYAYTGWKVLEEGAGAAGRVHAAGMPAQDRADPPDPGAYGLHPPPGGGGPGLRAPQLHRKSARAVPARQDPGLCPPHHRRAAVLRQPAARVLHPFSGWIKEGTRLKLESTLVLCDLDALMLGPDGNLTQVLRDVLQLFTARGGRLTVFSQKTPKAVRAILGSVPLAAPALLCGGTLVYSFSAGSGQPMGSFAALGDGFLAKLPAAPGIGIALQMKDGATRVVRMNHALERHLRREWTPYLLAQPEGVLCGDVLRVLLYQDARTIPALQTFEKALEESGAPVRQERLAIDCLALTPGDVSMGAAFSAVCAAALLSPEKVAVLAGSAPMVELMRLAGQSAAAFDAPAEVRLAAGQTTFCRASEGAAAEYLYQLVRNSGR